MECFDCPYGLDNDPKEEQIWCDKVGGKTSWYGYCSDVLEDIDIVTKYSNKKKRTKRERDWKYKHRLKWLDKYARRYPWPVIGIDASGFSHSYDEQPIYYKRLHRPMLCTRRLKHISNKTIRRHKNENFKGWQCHKLYDFWWELM